MIARIALLVAVVAIAVAVFRRPGSRRAGAVVKLGMIAFHAITSYYILYLTSVFDI